MVTSVTPSYFANSVVEYWFILNHVDGITIPDMWDNLDPETKETWLDDYKANYKFSIPQSHFISAINTFAEIEELDKIEYLHYDDLVPGKCYFGLIGLLPYIFKYFGDGKWSAGSGAFTIHLVKTATTPFSDNTFRVLPICEYTQDNLTSDDWDQFKANHLPQLTINLYKKQVVSKPSGIGLIKKNIPPVEKKIIRYINEA